LVEINNCTFNVEVGTGTRPLVKINNCTFNVEVGTGTCPLVEINNCTFNKCKPQSGLETYADGTTNDNSIFKINGNSQVQNVNFSDQIESYVYEVESVVDPTRTLQDTNDATLENFFKRPITIAEEEWNTSTTLGFDIDPWKLFFENKRVINRIANYNLLRAKLHVKIVINGNEFHYGRAMVSYLPFDDFDSLSANAALIRQDLVQASQQPHIFLDPRTSQGGDMILPFYNHRNYISIPEKQWREMGQLYFRSINTLKHANGADATATIKVFAYATDVKMSVLTSREPGNMGPQSGKEIDEVNEKGKVSGPATAIAKAAGAMKDVPYIGSFAHATEMVASTTAAVAKMHGYSRPPVTKNPEPYKPYPASALALANTGDGPTKLTIDDKQELTIDPRTAGLGGADPMNIKDIASRESYLTTFSWNMGTPPETLLWNMRLDPCIWAENAGPPTSYHFPACAMAALPYKYWTGSMKVRFQIVSSGYHKGRLKFVYDPNHFESNEYNTNYLNIVSLGKQNDFTIEIACGQDRTLLSHARPGSNSVTEMYSTTPYTSTASFGNGVLGVYVVNELTTPNSSVNNDIEINVFVSMGDDFEVFVPDDYFQYFTFKPKPQSGLEPQSGMEGVTVPESQTTDESSAPQHEKSIALGPTKSDTRNINRVFTGEAIKTFRTPLKRYNLWSAVGYNSDTDTQISGRYSMFPYLRGAVIGAVDATSSGDPYNYCNTVLLHWVTLAFSGWRGSIRYKLLPRGNFNADQRPTVYIQRHPVGEIEYYYSSSAAPTYNDRKATRRGVVAVKQPFPTLSNPFTGIKGQLYQSGYLNPAVEFEVPYYSQFRFTPGKEENHTGVNLFNEGWDYRIQGRGDTTSVWDIHVAAGEDFQTFFFTGLPRMYYEDIAPA
jgi:hypothetical protein